MRYNPAYAANGIRAESSPSAADIQVTRDLIRAGQLLKIDLLDHIVIGNGNHTSLRATGACIFS
jgi:DNA repair protein RadC